MFADGPDALAVALCAAIVVAGTLVTYLFDQRTPLPWRVPAGTCLGFAAFGLLGFVLATRFGLTRPIVFTAGAGVACGAGVLARSAIRRRVADDIRELVSGLSTALRRPSPAGLVGAVTCVGAALFLWRVSSRAVFLRDDGLYTGVSQNIGDLPFHLSVSARFLLGGNYPPEHPSFAGVGFTYPFLTDFIGAALVQAGLPIATVIVWSTFVLVLCVALLLYRWTLELTGSRPAALLAPPLALFSGGLGWWRFATEAAASDRGVVAFLARLPHDFTITPDNEFRWGNLLTSILVTQRGLLLGLPIAILVFGLWWQTLSADEDPDAGARAVRMIAAGAVTGMLPLVHAHTFAVVLGAGAMLCLLFPRRIAWLPFFAWALALGLPQVWWLSRMSNMDGRSFLAWSVGWDHGSQHPVVFWLKNTGVFIPLVLAGWLAGSADRAGSRRLRRYYVPFLLCFVVPNLFRLAPWIWDNIKVLIYWFIGSVPLAALGLGRLARLGRGGRIAAVAAFVACTAAGALDLWRVSSGAFESRVYDRAGMRFAEAVAGVSAPDALILHAPVHNHPVALSGRRSFMGYAGHVWSHGLDPGPREADIRRIYGGMADASRLLAQHRIEFVVIGPHERAFAVNDVFFARWMPIVEVEGYRLYQVAAGGRP
jgi:hypothetical protein